MKQQWKEALESAQRIALVCHVSPDMDTLGSAVGLRYILEDMGKTVTVYAQDEVAPRFMFLEGMSEVRLPDEEAYDLCVAVDVSDAARMGTAKAVFDRAKATAMIDHHPTTVPFAPAYVLDAKAAATAQIIVEKCGEFGWNIPEKAAMCLWSGISTDSGNFSFDSVTADTFRAAAVCVEKGAKPGVITERLYRTSTEGHVRLMGRVLNGLRLSHEGRICMISYTPEDLADCKAEQEDASGIINMALEIESVKMVAQLSQRDGCIKCSMRAKAPYDVAAVAKQFGGGGHVRAAGCSLYDMTMEEAGAVMEAALAKVL